MVRIRPEDIFHSRIEVQFPIEFVGWTEIARQSHLPLSRMGSNVMVVIRAMQFKSSDDFDFDKNETN